MMVRGEREREESMDEVGGLGLCTDRRWQSVESRYLESVQMGSNHGIERYEIRIKIMKDIKDLIW